MAQKIYDESEDHYSQLKSQEDEAAAKLFLNSINKLTEVDATTISDTEIECVIREVQEKVKISNSSYLKNAFPQAFT